MRGEHTVALLDTIIQHIGRNRCIGVPARWTALGQLANARVETTTADVVAEALVRSLCSSFGEYKMQRRTVTEEGAVERLQVV